MFTFYRSMGMNLLLYHFWHLIMNSGNRSSLSLPTRSLSGTMLFLEKRKEDTDKTIVVLGFWRLYLAYTMKSSLLLQMLMLISPRTKRRHNRTSHKDNYFLFFLQLFPELIKEFMFSIARVVCLDSSVI